MARGPTQNPWRKPVLALLRGGWVTVGEASRLAGVHSSRIWHWCKAAGFDPAAARDRRVAAYYARELLRMSKRDYSKLRLRGRETESIRGGMAPFMAPLLPRRARKAGPSKAELRAVADDAVIQFAEKRAAMHRKKR